MAFRKLNDGVRRGCFDAKIDFSRKLCHRLVLKPREGYDHFVTRSLNGAWYSKRLDVLHFRCHHGLLFRSVFKTACRVLIERLLKPLIIVLVERPSRVDQRWQRKLLSLVLNCVVGPNRHLREIKSSMGWRLLCLALLYLRRQGWLDCDTKSALFLPIVFCGCSLYICNGFCRAIL